MSEKIKIVRGKYDCEISNHKTIGENIKILRQNQNMTQEKFAESLFMSVRRISKIENNQVELTYGEMMQICDVLQVSVLALFFNVKINEILCDSKTGLNRNSIQWLTRLNYDNHGFIKMLNYLSTKPRLFEIAYDLMKTTIIKLKGVL